MGNGSDSVVERMGRQFGALLMACAVLFSSPVSAQSDDATRNLLTLTAERQALTAELDQNRKTLEMLHTDGTPAAPSPNPAITTLDVAAESLKKRLLAVTEREANLLQQQITAAKAKAITADSVKALTDASLEPGQEDASLSLHNENIDDTLEREAENVERLHRLLESYYAELQESTRTQPTKEEISQREMAQRDAETLNKIPFSATKVRLTGSEASTALADITQRLMNPEIPESRRDVAPILIIKTHLLDTLVGSESRSLKPVGKNHFIARVRLQPGDTTLSILSDQWLVQLPQSANATDYLITLYRPTDGAAELHVFAVEDLLAASRPHIPAWLPDELDIKKKTG